MKVSVFLAAIFFSFTLRAEVVAIIGSPLSVELGDDPCAEFHEQPDPSSGFQEVCLSDRKFHLTYAVREVLAGEHTKDTIDFVSFYHYGGMPSYTRYETALLVLSKESGFLRLRYIEQAEERDSGWWVCEEWPEAVDGDCVVERSAQEVIESVAKRN